MWVSNIFLEKGGGSENDKDFSFCEKWEASW